MRARFRGATGGGGASLGMEGEIDFECFVVYNPNFSNRFLLLEMEVKGSIDFKLMGRHLILRRTFSASPFRREKQQVKAANTSIYPSRN